MWACQYSCLFLFQLLVAAAAETQPITASLSIDLPDIGPNTKTGLVYYGDAAPPSTEGIQLTKNRVTDQFNQSFGRAIYEKELPLWSDLNLVGASFNTSFNFIIRLPDSNANSGDGIAFLVCSPHVASQVPLLSSGMYLGLFNDTTNNSTAAQIVAVEFDTYQNPTFDINNNHVGVDVNAIQSVKSENLTDSVILKSDKTITAWIDYSATPGRLDVYVAYQGSTKPTSPVLSYDIFLPRFLPQNVSVGFSASTGAAIEFHYISSWSFTSTEIVIAQPVLPPSQPLSNPPLSPRQPSHHVGLIIGLSVGVGVLVLIALVIGCVVVYRKRNSKRKRNGFDRLQMDNVQLAELDQQNHFAPHKFEYRELLAATKKFSKKELLGKGGFGPVYRGTLPKENKLIAVKCIAENSKQGVKEFVAEISIISRIRHRNLVQLQGWCHHKGELFVVYDFMANGSLDTFLFRTEPENPQEAGKQRQLDWKKRYEIVRGVAAGILYLHEEWENQVIHRDIKASNVLLDADFNARLGDFGLARLVEHDKMPETTFNLAGTLGYLAPECSQTFKATAESDVFSFGAVALETACGRRPVEPNLPPNEVRLVDWVWELYEQDRLLEAVDPKLHGDYDQQEMRSLLILGLACSHPNPKARPTIRQALTHLTSQPPLPPPILKAKPQAIYGYPPPVSIEGLLVSSSSTNTSSNATTQSTSSRSSARPHLLDP